ncbi:MAG TPA: MFS transporter [Novosphingobium sp.]|nr:MFS transporter [Novosphingobium sp.]
MTTDTSLPADGPQPFLSRLPTTRAGSWPAILAIYAYAELIAACHGKTLLLVPDVARSFAVDPARASWVIAAVALVAAVGAPFGGWLIDRLGEHRAIRLGLALAAPSSLAAAFVPRFAELVLLRVIEGAGYIAVVLGCLSLLIRTTSGPRQTTALAFWSVASPMGGALAILAVSPLAGTAQWRWVFAGHAGLLLLALVASPLLPAAPPRARASERGGASPWAVYRQPAALRFLGAVLLLQVFALGEAALLPTYLLTAHQLRPAEVGLLSAVSIALSVLGGVGAGVLYNRGAGIERVTAVALLVTLAGVLVCFHPAAPTAAVIAGRLVSAISGGAVFAWISTRIPRIAPARDQIGLASGAVSQLLYIGMTAGPPALFALYELPGRAGFYGFILLAYSLPLLAVARGAWRPVAEAAPAEPLHTIPPFQEF